MDSFSAFYRGEAARAAGNPQRVFDWDRAATLIREQTPEVASAGLSGDWEWTGGDIYRNGAPVPADDTYVYLSSCWATPQLDLDGCVIDCWKYEDATPGWDASTYWPDSALAILVGGAA